MLENLYADRNRNRSRPCIQSRHDSFRLLKYDVATAADLSDHAQPLLMRRHNVLPGMFLVGWTPCNHPSLMPSAHCPHCTAIADVPRVSFAVL